MNLSNLKVMVYGMARSGIAAAGLLCRNGAAVTIADSKNKDELKSVIASLSDYHIGIVAGQNPEGFLSGMDMLVLSPGVPADLPFIVYARNMGIKVIGEIELACMFCKCPIAAITGTNGKTTATALLGEIFKNFNGDTFVVGNIGNPFCEDVEKISPNSLCAAELSSFQLESISEFKPKTAAVLNVTPDHLDRHKTMENYISIKERIFMNQSQGDYLILNYDDPNCRIMASKAKSRAYFFSSSKKLKEGAYLDCGNIYLRAKGYNMPLLNVKEMKLLGAHNYENAMAAALMAVCMDIPIDTIINTLKSFNGVEHRIEFVRTVKGAGFYNDSKATNPEAGIKAIEAMEKPIILIGGGYDKAANFETWVKSFGDKVKHLVLIGETANQIDKVCREAGFTDLTHAQSLREAVNIAYEKADRGDSVLLSPACASWDMFDSFEQRGNLFKEYVLELEE